MKKISFFSDVFFAFFVSFLFTLLFFRHLRVAVWLAVLLAALCGALVAFAVGAYLHAKRKNVFAKKSETIQKEKLAFHLAIAGNESNAEFFKTLLLNGENPPTEIKRTGKNRLTAPDEVYFFQCTFAPVTADDAAAIIRLKTKRQKILFCNDVDEDARKICNRFHIRIVNGDDVFTLAKAANVLPQVFFGDEAQEKNKKRHIKLWFSKSNSRRFLLSATLVLLLSRLTPFPYYYVVFGVLLLCAAVFTRIFGKE